MNDKFYQLPEEKQLRIINAGFRIFANNSYKKSPVGEIAAEAGISKSLLFHYFHNKKELYLFLWQQCSILTVDTLVNSGCYDTDDMFEAMHRGLKAKIGIMQKYPDVGRFAIRGFYEKDPDVADDVKELIQRNSAFTSRGFAQWFVPERYVEGLDLKMMYKDMYWASEGFIWEKMNADRMDLEELEKEYVEMINFWKKVYLRHESD